MPTLRVELPARVSARDLEALQADLEPYGHVAETPPTTFATPGACLDVALFLEAIQAVDVLVRWLSAWLRQRPRANQVTIRLADGGSFELRADNEEAFRAALKAAVRKL